MAPKKIVRFHLKNLAVSFKEPSREQRHSFLKKWGEEGFSVFLICFRSRYVRLSLVLGRTKRLWRYRASYKKIHPCNIFIYLKSLERFLCYISTLRKSIENYYIDLFIKLSFSFYVFKNICNIIHLSIHPNLSICLKL